MLRTLLLAAALLTVAAPPAAASDGAPSLTPRGARMLWVDATRGSDRSSGTRAHPLRTVTAAWERIAPDRALQRPVVITLRPGRCTASQTPTSWERRHGSARAPIVIRASTRTATLPAVNMFDVRWLAIDGVRFRDRFDLFHCESCAHVLLSRNRLDGSRRLHENVKVNQSTWMFLRGNRIDGADDNAVDFVAVQHGEIAGNDISGAGDWCAYAQGGSAHLRITGNRIHRCGTGGFTAGQGTGLQFLTAPFVRYEAYGIVVSGNSVWDTAGAAFGVNGGLNVAIVNNRAWNVGRRSHLVEVVFGLRSCDGRPGDEGRQACRANLDAGGWGTTRLDDGDNAVRIPDRNVTIAGNVFGGPAGRNGQLLSIARPFAGAAQDGSGLGTVRPTTACGPRNRFAVGTGFEDGTDGCARRTAAGCAAVTVSAAQNPFTHERRVAAAHAVAGRRDARLRLVGPAGGHRAVTAPQSERITPASGAAVPVSTSR